MPQPERLLGLIRRAVEAFRATPGRRGHVIYLTDALEICVAGDMHGNVDNFSRLLKVADLGKNPGRHLVLQEVIHGKFRYPPALLSAGLDGGSFAALMSDPVPSDPPGNASAPA